jgi:hypothetical protein
MGAGKEQLAALTEIINEPSKNMPIKLGVDIIDDNRKTLASVTLHLSQRCQTKCRHNDLELTSA